MTTTRKFEGGARIGLVLVSVALLAASTANALTGMDTLGTLVVLGLIVAWVPLMVLTLSGSSRRRPVQR